METLASCVIGEHTSFLMTTKYTRQQLFVSVYGFETYT